MISENLQRIITAKADIKNAVEEKGVTIPSSATIDEYADYIEQIEQGGGGGITPEIVRSNVWVQKGVYSTYGTAFVPFAQNGKIAQLSNTTMINRFGMVNVGDSLYQIDRKLNFSTMALETYAREGYNNAEGMYVWTDGEHIYYSYNTYQYVLQDGNWVAKTWTGLANFYGNNIWTDGTTIYHTSGSTSYILDPATSTWTAKTWSGVGSYFYGANIWTDGEDIYHYNSNWNGYRYPRYNYKYDKATDTWSTEAVVTDTSDNMYADGSCVWTDGTDIYYTNARYSSYGTFRHSWIWDKVNKRWDNQPYSGLDGLAIFSGTDVWTDGTDIYLTLSSEHFKLNKATFAWESITWYGNPMTAGYDLRHSWTDGTNRYYSSGSDHYLMTTPTTWVRKSWTGLSSFYGEYIWTDGTNIYYSNGDSNQFVLDKDTSTWESIAWGGIDYVDGNNVWTDGEHIYYSSGTTQYELVDKATRTWADKTWTGATNFNGKQVWGYGGKIFLAPSTSQIYELDKETSTWTAKYWNGGPYYKDGEYFWTDGTNIYYDSYQQNYKVDVDNYKMVGYSINGMPYMYCNDNITSDPTKKLNLSCHATMDTPHDITTDDDIYTLHGSYPYKLMLAYYYCQIIED